MIDSVLALGFGGWLLYLSVRGARKGVLYSRRYPIDDGHEYTYRSEQPVTFWLLLMFYVGVSMVLIWAGLFA